MFIEKLSAYRVETASIITAKKALLGNIIIMDQLRSLISSRNKDFRPAVSIHLI